MQNLNVVVAVERHVARLLLHKAEQGGRRFTAAEEFFLAPVELNCYLRQRNLVIVRPLKEAVEAVDPA